MRLTSILYEFAQVVFNHLHALANFQYLSSQ